MKTEIVNAGMIRHGDTVLIDDKQYTVGKYDVRHYHFLGTTTIFGKRMQKVERVLFTKWFKGEAVALVAQI